MLFLHRLRYREAMWLSCWFYTYKKQPGKTGLKRLSKSIQDYGGERGIRTPEAALTTYTISNRAP